ncbi:MAG: hypothetical protein ACOH1T_06865 [Microbacteriaceae bacterium]
MTPVSKPGVLSIGILIGGRTQQNKPWVEGVTAVSNFITDNADHYSSAFSVNVHFHIPGDMIVPDFEGVKVGRFIRSENGLIVKAALPPIPPDDVRSEVVGYLRKAIAVAAEWSRKKKHDETFERFQDLVTAISGAE